MKRNAWAYIKTGVFNDKERVNILIKRNCVSKKYINDSSEKEVQAVLMHKMILNL